MCACPAVAAVLSRPGNQLPRKFVSGELPAGPAEPSLHREQAFALDEGEGTLLGIIDRIVLWRRSGRKVAAELIDFKFDGLGGEGKSAPRARIRTEKTAFYTPQLADYRRAVAQLFSLAPHAITADLVFMRAGTIVRVEA
jgi:ATP-dependent exoDNAse (exonuclease V) beta subunit